VVSGKTYEEYIDETFFKPLGMRNSYYGSTSRIIKNRAQGYQKEGEEYKNAAFLSMTQPYSAGSLISTVDDLFRWYTAVMDKKVVTPSSLEKAQTSYVLNNGGKTGYGYGWSIGNIQGSPMISHGGGINGYLTSSLYLPDEKLFVALFSNCDCKDPGGPATKMAALALGKPFEWKKISVPGNVLQSYEAVYSSEYNGNITITYAEGKLYSMRSGGSRYELLPYEKDKFYFDEGFTTFHFNRNSDGEIISFISKSTGQDVEFIRTDKPVPTIKKIKLEDELLKKYTGKYQLTPDFQIQIFREEEKMYTQATGQNKVEIVAYEKHKFSVVGVDAKITFNLNEEGEVVSLTIHQNGDHTAEKIE
ncbi:MAG: serine hydrolase, partial [Bacteroidales bacterium]